MAATHFAFLILGRPLDTVMFRGEDAAWLPQELTRMAEAATDVFLAAYGPPPPDFVPPPPDFVPE